jgi:intergrase/recombinase
LSSETREFCGTKTNKLFFKINKIFLDNKERFKTWANENLSSNYARTMTNAMEKNFLMKIKSIEHFQQLIGKGKLNTKTANIGFRVFFNFCEDKRLLQEEELLYLRRNIKFKKSKCRIDTFVPTKNEIERSLSVLRNEYPDYFVLYQFMIESGCRFSELRHFILNYDEKNLEVHDDICCYRNFYLRGQKSSFYLFFTIKTFEKLNLDKFSKYELDRFRDRVARNDSVVSAKYLRKYNFTLLIQAGVEFEIANFIQGRTSQNIGFNHYLAKKEVALREYGKLLIFFG